MPTPKDAPYKILQGRKSPWAIYLSQNPTGIFKMRDGKKYRFVEEKNPLGQVTGASIRRVR